MIHPRALSAGLAAAVLAILTAGCGYRVAGRADLLPKNIRTIAVMPFQNATARYRLSDRLAAAITREFLSRTRYDVVADPNQADAELTGSVASVNAYSVVFDPSTGRATTVQMHVYLNLQLRDRKTGAVLFARDRMEVRERYEISLDQAAYLEESDAAMDRLSRDVARSVVSAVLENF